MPGETPQEYTRRIIETAGRQDPRKVQAATPAKLERLIRGVPARKLLKRPAPQKWSVAEILAHLADSEIVVGWRMRQILGAPGITLQPFDQDVWAATGHYDKRDARLSVAQFRALRDGHLALLKSLTPKQWQDFGLHAERGKESIKHIVRMVAGHDINHLKQIEHILTAPK